MALIDGSLWLLRLIFPIQFSEFFLLFQFQDPVPEVPDSPVLPVKIGVQQVNLLLEVGHNGIPFIADHFEFVHQLLDLAVVDLDVAGVGLLVKSQLVFQSAVLYLELGGAWAVLGWGGFGSGF